jgi:hypothetical protein
LTPWPAIAVRSQQTPTKSFLLVRLVTFDWFGNALTGEAGINKEKFLVAGAHFIVRGEVTAWK